MHAAIAIGIRHHISLTDYLLHHFDVASSFFSNRLRGNFEFRTCGHRVIKFCVANRFTKPVSSFAKTEFWWLAEDFKPVVTLLEIHPEIKVWIVTVNCKIVWRHTKRIGLHLKFRLTSPQGIANDGI